MLKFPRDFFWGSATSAYQVEGGNMNSDWWEWEIKAGLKERSGQACRHYQFYQEDFDLAKGLNHNALRLSVEWSRIEPQEGKFSSQEIQHYKEVILSLRERGIEPIVTLHHFTNPAWLAKLGGWENKEAGAYFLRYARKIVSALCSQVRFWVTINEPLVYVYHSYLLGAWPPQEKSFLKAKRVETNLLNSHIDTYRLIHRIYKESHLPPAQVSIAKNLQAFAACGPSPINRLSAYFRDRIYNFSFIERLIRQRSLDYIGINYYTRSLVDVRGSKISNFLLDTCREGHSNLEKNSLGWDIYPEGLYQLLLRLKRYNLPVFILENGICTEDDGRRWGFIRRHLESANLAMQQGVGILGYLYWSLMDNFEWDKGFSPRFGLIEVDYADYRRSVRESARKFALVCKEGTLE